MPTPSTPDARPGRAVLRAGALVVTLGALGSSAACYPEFRFGDETDGEGGSSAETSSSRAVSSSSSSGGGMTGTSSTTSTSTSSSSSTGDTTSTSTGTGPAPPQVSCNQNGVTTPAPCAPGASCCFDESNPALDNCSDAGCGSNQFDLGCDGPEDCPGQICCADMRLSRVLGLPRFEGTTSCMAACAPPDHVVCHGDEDCSGGSCIPLFDGDYTYYAPEYEPHFRVCFQPL